jgi:hypothetical protein
VKILQFLLANWDSVLILLLFAAAITYIIIKKRWDLLDKILFGLVTWAEREYGNGTGALKLSEVIQRFYPQIPAIARLFLSAEKVESIVDDALTAAKERWQQNPKLIETAATQAAQKNIDL